MKTVAKTLLLSCVLVVVTGCGIQGRWTLQSITPESEKAHFNLQCMCLMSDGSYMAAAQEEGKSTCLKGTYTYDGKTKLLTFKTDSKERAYHADLMCPGSKMKVTPAEAGESWTATMKRAGSCSKDKCCCMGQMCGGKPCDPKKCPMNKSDQPAEKKPVETKAGETK
jgi:hypothetical protein